MSSLYQNLLNRCSQENSPAPKATEVPRIRRSSIRTALPVTTCTKYIGRLTQDRKKKQRKSVRFSSNVLMQQAITEGDVQEVKQLIEEFGSRVVNEPEPSELSPSMRCVFEGQMAPLRLLIEAGADLTAQGECLWWTVLHVAASMDDVDATKLSCKHCKFAQWTARDRSTSPKARKWLDFFSRQTSCRVVDSECAVMALVEEHIYTSGSCEALNGALRRSTDYDSLLHMAAGKNYPRLASYLLQHSVCKMEARDSRGWTALHTVAYFNNIDMVLLLTQQGASIHSLTNSYEDASDLTTHKLVYSLLREEYL